MRSRENPFPGDPSAGSSSLGASGDLAPLAHVGLCLIGEGWVLEDDELVPACRALARARLEPTRLRTKEGLTLINGTDGRCWGWHVRYPSGGVG